MSFKPEVSTDGGKSFHQNNLAFATRDEAEISARSLMPRWTLGTDWRAVESAQPVNYRICRDGALKAIDGKIGEGAPA